MSSDKSSTSDDETENIIVRFIGAHSFSYFYKDDPIIFETLLKSNPSLINSKGEDGRTPLHVAAMQSKSPAVELLIAYGADVNMRDKNGATPLHLAANYERRDREQPVYKILLEAKADVYARDNLGNTPLMSHLLIVKSYPYDSREATRISNGIVALLEEKQSVGNTADHSKAKGIIQGVIDAQAFRKKIAIILAIVGLILPIISHIILLIWYLARKVDVVKLQLDRADFMDYKNRWEHKPAFDLVAHEKMKPVQKKLDSGIICQRKLIELSPNDDGLPVSLFFESKKQSEAFTWKVNNWAKRNHREVKIKPC